jgi:predicted ester cyclase
MLGLEANPLPVSQELVMSIDINVAKEMVLPFYDLLNQPGTKAVAAAMQKLAADDWRSYAGESASKSREEFVAQVIRFGKLIPDLAWSIKEVLVAGDRIIVRSEASGTPAGEFFGVPHTGRGFRIMAIDIHTVRNGKLTVAYHVEDWASALRQLAGK